VGLIFDNLPYFETLYKANPPANQQQIAVPRTEYGAVFAMGSLDNTGAMSAGLTDVNAVLNRKDISAYLDRSSDYIMHKQLRLADGTLARIDPHKNTLWADDMFMSIPFLARMGKMTGDKKYYDDAIKQVMNFTKYLYDPNTGLYWHCYYTDQQTNGVAHWGRCNGWIAMAQVELLKNLPANHPKRAELIALLQRQILGFSRYQDNNGLWHQLLDKPDSYLETSCTAMFTYTIATAVNEGWINERYITIARDAWKALQTHVTPDGQLQDVCVGTGVEENLRFYYTRPTPLNDTHGLGPFLMAGSEMYKYEHRATVKR
jgi:unsaturated rhamnogalacturonyl hydrolase